VALPDFAITELWTVMERGELFSPEWLTHSDSLTEQSRMWPAVGNIATSVTLVSLLPRSAMDRDVAVTTRYGGQIDGLTRRVSRRTRCPHLGSAR
jgi:hypothetical protein